MYTSPVTNNKFGHKRLKGRREREREDREREREREEEEEEEEQEEGGHREIVSVDQTAVCGADID